MRRGARAITMWGDSATTVTAASEDRISVSRSVFWWTDIDSLFPLYLFVADSACLQ